MDSHGTPGEVAIAQDVHLIEACMSPANALRGNLHSTATRRRWTDLRLLEAIALRVAKHRQDPTAILLNPLACVSDSGFRRVYNSAARRSRSIGPGWWEEWLVRAGMTQEEASVAGRRYRRHDPSREGVLKELMEVYSEAIGTRVWPGPEPELNGALRLRVEKVFDSCHEGRKAAKKALGIPYGKARKKQARKRNRKARQDRIKTRPRALTEDEHQVVRDLCDRVGSFLPIDNAKVPRMSLRAIAAELGLRRWRGRGLTRCVRRLFERAMEKSQETFQRLICIIVKRGVRYQYLKGIAKLLRWDTSRQPIWREHVLEINSILGVASLGIRELGDERFLRALPSQMRRLDHGTFSGSGGIATFNRWSGQSLSSHGMS